MKNNISKEEIKTLIVDLLYKEEVHIVNDCIKIWETDYMLMSDVKRAADNIKSKGFPKVLVYTNKVPNKNYIEKNEEIKIFDYDDLCCLSIRHDSDLVEFL